MDGDGLILYLSLLLVAFALGSIFMLFFVKFENKKPPFKKEDVEKEIKEKIKRMSIVQFATWLKE